MPDKPSQIWKHLRKEKREDIIAKFVGAVHNGFWPDGMPRLIADILGFRESTILNARGDQLGRLLRHAAATRNESFLLPLLFVYQIETDILPIVYDALGVEHDDIALTPEVLEEPLNPDTAIQGVLDLAEALGVEDVLLCFEVMGNATSDAWRPTVEAIVERLREEAHQEESTVVETATEDAEHTTSWEDPRKALTGNGPMSEGSAKPSGLNDDSGNRSPGLNGFSSPEFSNLDKVLIRSVISSLNRVEGSLSIDDLDDLVNETLELNDCRTKSHFHRGFLDALTDRELKPMGPGENRGRRAWYLAGYANGVMRQKGEVDEAASFFLGLNSKDRGVLIDTPEPAGIQLVPYIVRPLLDQNLIKEAEAWIRRYLPVAAPSVLATIVEWAGHALVKGDPNDVRRVLEYCNTQLEAIGEAHGPVPHELEGDLRRRLAIALRVTGYTTNAECILDDLIAEEDDPSRRSILLGNKILLQMGIRSVEALKIGPAETRETLLASIQLVANLIRTGTQGVQSPSPVPLMASALPIVMDPHSKETATRAAIEDLRNAIIAMERWNRPLWEEKGVLTRARFYLSLLQLRLLDQALAAAAVSRLIGLLVEGIDEPLDLVVEAVSNAVLQDAPEASTLAREAIRKWPQATLQSLDIEALVRRSADFRASVVDAMEKNRSILTTSERWQSWVGILRGSLTAPERDVDLATRALDELETLAEQDGFAVPFADILANSRNWDPAWSRTEAEFARFRVLESLGELANARPLLHGIAHRLISEDDPDAPELVNTIAALGEPEESLADLRCRLAAAGLSTTNGTEDAGAVGENSTPAHILFIGGNETQASYQERLLRSLSESHPNCSVEFEFPGWSSNWGPLADTYKRKMKQADAVVLMRFMRTNLGRTLRKATDDAGIPWVACTGHGLDSLLRSIIRAIEVARALRVKAAV